MKQKVLLMILDGWGIGNRSKGDVISTVHPAYISAMTEKYPHAQLHTDGENVGLPDLISYPPIPSKVHSFRAFKRVTVLNCISLYTGRKGKPMIPNNIFR